MVTTELHRLIANDSLAELSASLNIPAVIFSCEFAATCAKNPPGVAAMIKVTLFTFLLGQNLT
jgi:hypothetical protein